MPRAVGVAHQREHDEHFDQHADHGTRAAPEDLDARLTIVFVVKKAAQVDNPDFLSIFV